MVVITSTTNYIWKLWPYYDNVWPYLQTKDGNLKNEAKNCLNWLQGEQAIRRADSS